MVKRPNYVKIKAQDRNGMWHEYEGEELLARAFCHETDHLDGNMFMRLVDEWVEVEQD
jgi:peptide deformylase